MRGLGNLADIGGGAEDVGSLDDDAGRVRPDLGDHGILGVDGGGQHLGLDADGVNHRLGRGDIVGVDAAGDHRLVAAGGAGRHQDALGHGGRAVIEGRIGHLHAGQGRHLGLEFVQVLKRALGDFRLVRRVAGQELRPLDDVIDRRRHMVAIGPSPTEEGH